VLALKIPKHITNKLIRIDNIATQLKEYSGEVEEWLESKGVDVARFREGNYSVLEQAEYGELNSSSREDLEREMLGNILESQRD
jgi:hypothetical protein